MKISINQKSGLGNQLFQYAAGLYFARKYSARLEIVRDPPHLAVSHGYPRPFLLSRFNIQSPVRDRTALDRLLCSEKPGNLALTRLMRLVSGTRIYREPIGSHWIYQPDLPIAPSTRHLYIEGYWQTYRFAQQIEPQLRGELAFREPTQGKTLEVLNQIRAAELPVSIHLRRGDYTVAAEGIHTLPMVYYRNAMQDLRSLVPAPEPTFIVFSDDIAFARENLPHSSQIIFVDHTGADSAHEDLRLMSACRHHIIANSSFSWWGAWLNANPAKLVFAPDRWLDPKLPHPDLIPPAWRRIPAQ